MDSSKHWTPLGSTVGPSNKQCPFEQQQPLYPLVLERLRKFEDIFEKFMQAYLANQKNNEITIRNLETHVGKIAKELTEWQSGQFSARIK